MTNALVISVRLHEGWYHGSGAIPSPARLFQALIAGQGLSGPLQREALDALEWLERQPPPIVAVPAMKPGQPVATYVPNNDLDGKPQGDHRRIGEIRAKKTAHPLLFDASLPFLYCWELNNDDTDKSAVEHIQELANGLYQLGRTLDAAWACADVVTADELGDHLRCHRGPVLRPASGHGNVECPTPGSLGSLIIRHADMARRYGRTADGKGQTFRRRSKPKWRMVSYDSTPPRVCFDLLDGDSKHVAWPPTDTVELVTSIRDAAVAKLVDALPDREPEIRQTLIGRKPNGENAGPTSARVRIVPLPSIGHEHADQQIRRILIEIPGNCPLRSDDVVWAFSGQQLMHKDQRIDLVKAQPHRQLEHYGVAEKAFRLWQTVTPLFLSTATRRRIEPDVRKRRPGEEKGAAEKRMEQEIAAAGVRQALRHAGYETTVQGIRVQREPFTGRGQKADAFAAESRFNKHSLWHVSVEVTDAISGPMVVGDGRFLGLGLMRPVVMPTSSDGGAASDGVFAFAVESGLLPNPDPIHLARALRRAVMARVQHELGATKRLPTFFSAHYQDGTPAKSEKTPHLAFQFDPNTSLLLILAPNLLDRHASRRHTEYLATLDSALRHFNELRAGKAGHLRLQPVSINPSDSRLFCLSKCWKSATPYSVNRHGKHSTANGILRNDITAECERRGFPRPEVDTLDWTARSGVGLLGHMQLTFQQSVSGPIILGRTRHLGGGLFVAHPCGSEA